MPEPTKSRRRAGIPTADLASLAIANSRRHGTRTAVNVTGISVAVAALVFFLAFFRGTYENVMFASVIDYATSHGQFSSLSFDEDDPGSWLAPGSLLDQAMLERPSDACGGGSADSFEALVSGRLASPAFAGDGTRKAPVALYGVDFAKEAAMCKLASRMVEGEFGGGAVIGKKLAEALSLSVGDVIRFQANASDGAPNLDYWTVSGIFSSGYPPLDRGIAMLPLADAQRFLSAGGKVNKIYCRLAPAGDSYGREAALSKFETPEARARLAGLGLKFDAWRAYAKAIVDDSKMDGAFYSVFIAILLFLSISTLSGTMRAAVFERKREIGMLRAVGWQSREVGKLFLLESLAIGVVGASIGCAIGSAAALALAYFPVEVGASMGDLDIPSFSLTCDLSAADIAAASLTGIVAAVIAGISPALSGARMPILRALSEA
jgi:ABC-type lipoprotein release transport system permease subunit